MQAEEVVGGDAAEEEGWEKISDCPIADERREVSDDHDKEPEVIVSGDGVAAQVPMGLPAPQLPSKAMIDRHNLTHIPYAPWCEHCVSARRNNTAHKQKFCAAYRRSIPLLVMDYGFARDGRNKDLTTTLIAKVYPCRKPLAMVADTKGRDPLAI